jgi:hypothetical protein
MKTHYGCPIIGGNDMQGEQFKGSNASCLSFAYLPAGGALLYSGLRSVTMTELNAACFGRQECPSLSQSILRPFNWEDKKMLSRRSLLGSLVKSLLAAGVIAAPLAAIVMPSEVEAEQTPSPSPAMGAPLHRGGGARQHYRRKMAEGRRKRRAAWRTRKSH